MERGFLETPSPLILTCEFWWSSRSHMSCCHWWVHRLWTSSRGHALATGLPPSSSEGPPPFPRWTRATASFCLQRGRLDTQSLEKGLTSEGPEAFTLHHHQDIAPYLTPARQVLPRIYLSKGRLLNTQISGSSLWILFRIWGRPRLYF